jgi:hypothetical protein
MQTWGRIQYEVQKKVYKLFEKRAITLSPNFGWGIAKSDLTDRI